MKRAFWALAILFIAVVVAADLGLYPGVFSWVQSVPGSDKFLHFLFVGALALLAELALGGRRFALLGRRPGLGSTLIAVAATLEEFSQLFLPRRSFDPLDLLFDYAGILVLGALGRRLSARSAPAPQ